MVFNVACEAKTKVIAATDSLSEIQGQSHSMSVRSGETARQSLQARVEEVSSPFPPIRLTAPESPRMDRARYTNKDK